MAMVLDLVLVPQIVVADMVMLAGYQEGMTSGTAQQPLAQIATWRDQAMMAWLAAPPGSAANCAFVALTRYLLVFAGPGIVYCQD